MSTEVLKQVIGRAVADPEYRGLLFTDPGMALEGLDLTEEETLVLKTIQRENFEKIATELAERISRVGLGLVSRNFDSGIHKAIHSGGPISPTE